MPALPQPTAFQEGVTVYFLDPDSKAPSEAAIVSTVTNVSTPVGQHAPVQVDYYYLTGYTTAFTADQIFATAALLQASLDAAVAALH